MRKNNIKLVKKVVLSVMLTGVLISCVGCGDKISERTSVNNEQQTNVNGIEDNADAENNMDNENSDNTENSVENAEKEEAKEQEILATDDEMVVKAYKYIPTVYYNEIMPTAYQDKKVEINDLSNQVKLINVFKNIKFKRDEITDVIDPGLNESMTFWVKDEEGNECVTGWYSFDKEVMHKYAKEFYGDDIILTDETIKISWAETCTYNDETGMYRYSDGGAGSLLTPVSTITKAYIEEDMLYIFDKYLLISESSDAPNKYDIYSSSVSDVMEKVEINMESISDIEHYVMGNYKDKMAEYKHTFKKNDNGEYYWVSTEPVK